IAVTGTVQSPAGEPVDNAQINLRNNSNNFLLNTNSNGEFAKCNMVPGSYDFTAGKWGFVTNCEPNDINSASELEKQLEPGYFDDFQFNFGWQTAGSAIAGKWIRAIPFGTSYNGAASNPSADVSDDCNSFAFVTGNASNSSAGTD